MFLKGVQIDENTIIKTDSILIDGQYCEEFDEESKTFIVDCQDEISLEDLKGSDVFEIELEEQTLPINPLKFINEVNRMKKANSNYMKPKYLIGYHSLDAILDEDGIDEKLSTVEDLTNLYNHGVFYKIVYKRDLSSK